MENFPSESTCYMVYRIVICMSQNLASSSTIEVLPTTVYVHTLSCTNNNIIIMASE